MRELPDEQDAAQDPGVEPEIISHGYPANQWWYGTDDGADDGIESADWLQWCIPKQVEQNRQERQACCTKIDQQGQHQQPAVPDEYGEDECMTR